MINNKMIRLDRVEGHYVVNY